MKNVIEFSEKYEYIFIRTRLADVISSAIAECSMANVLGDGDRLVVPYELESVQKVAQWHIPVVSPMLRDYDFVGRFQPYLHQLKICSFLTSNRRAFCLADMGTGKSASVVWSLDYLFKFNKIKKVLIIGVLTNLKSTWVEEFFSINPQITVTILHGEKEERQRLAGDDAMVHIINHDGVDTIPNELMANKYDVVVIDELTAYKNASSTRFKITAPIANQATYCWGLTGTPTPNKPHEAYGQIKIINPDKVKNISSYRFKEMTMNKFGSFTWKPRFDAPQIVQSYMQPAIKIDKSDVLVLPNVEYKYHNVPLTKEQMDFYKLLKAKQVANDGDISVTAVNGGALMSKLLQVATGAIYDDEGTALSFDTHGRVDLTVQLIKEARAKAASEITGKTIVFAPFRHTVAMLERELKKHFNVAVITGDTSPKQRAVIFSDFQTTDKPDVILAVPSTMSHGVTATAASSIIWFGPVTSNEVYQQACNRIDRPGQKEDMTIHHLYGSPVEHTLYKVLKERKLQQADLLNLYKDFVEGI